MKTILTKILFISMLLSAAVPLALLSAEETEQKEMARACLKSIFEEDPSKVNFSSDKGTPLGQAASNNDTKTMKMLLECKADINATDGKGFRPLTIAVGLDCKDAVNLLLDQGAFFTYKDLKSSHKKDTQCITKLLRKYLANVKQED